MNETQNTTVTIWSAVLLGSTANHGLTMRNSATAAIPPRIAAIFRLLAICFPSLPIPWGRTLRPSLDCVNCIQPTGVKASIWPSGVPGRPFGP